MASLIDFTEDDTLDSSNDPLRLVDILLFPVAVVITAMIVVVTYVFVMLCDRLLALNPMNTPRSVSMDSIRDDLPIDAPPSPTLAGSIRG